MGARRAMKPKGPSVPLTRPSLVPPSAEQSPTIVRSPPPAASSATGTLARHARLRGRNQRFSTLFRKNLPELRGSREGWARHFLSHAIPFIIEFVSCRAPRRATGGQTCRWATANAALWGWEGRLSARQERRSAGKQRLHQAGARCFGSETLS
eukprot:scaffold7635_cov78-Phaeocystis_antarctica.AAC.1